MMKLRDFPPQVLAVLLLATLVFSGMAMAGSANQEKAAAKRKELQQLRARIKKAQHEINAEKGQRGDLTRHLEESERKIGHLATAIEQTKTNLADAHARLDHLHAAKKHAQKALSHDKGALKRSIVASYEAGRETRFKLFLNQENPALLSRLLVYYDYFNRARGQHIQSVRRQLAKLSRINTSIHDDLERLTALKKTHHQALARLQATRAERAQLLAKVNAAISRHGSELARMQQNEKTLSKLLESLRHALSNTPLNIKPGASFVKLKNQLVWPIHGHIVAHFGDAMINGKLHWHGDLIAAPRGTPVHAIAYGRVIYADWLAHFGLLVIIDHGDGYMSLYGHNQSIYTRVGDRVKPGETIATLGASGGRRKPALYFEIRHGKTALDPSRWCASTPPQGK
jgi:septal ring factor EnvC (AmiA/AmiB activator)